ncbi:MAG: response regulator transcription factor [Candidatus Sericytochromatia bacterium]|nr:response regulator transcription factor [Candidatus Sericytochromatia bacterium]
MARILIADDDPNMRLLLQKQLEHEGHAILTVSGGSEAIETCRREGPDLLILDLMMPDVDGLEVCRQLRRDHALPIIMLTAKASDTDKVVGLAVGADEYMTKPFSMIELAARVRANLRRVERVRQSMTDACRILEVGNLRIDDDEHTVTLGERALELPYKEYKLLVLLVANLGKAITRDTILFRVWGDDFFGDDRVVDVHICRLRDKLERLGPSPVEIRTVRGVGYRCVAVEGERTEAS